MNVLLENNIQEYRQKIVIQEQDIKLLQDKNQQQSKINEILLNDIKIIQNKIGFQSSEQEKMAVVNEFIKEQIKSFEEQDNKKDINTYLNYLNLNPQIAIDELIQELDILRLNCQKGNNDKIESVKIEYAEVFYSGELVRIRLPQIKSKYTFNELLQDACAYFNLDYLNCILLDETYSIWPSHFKLREQLKMSPNIKIILSGKQNVRKQKKKVNDEDDKQVNQEENKQVNQEENQQMDQEENEQDKIMKMAEDLKKENRQNEIFSSGDSPRAKFSDFISLILYLVFVSLIADMLTRQFPTDNQYNLNQGLKDIMFKTKFNKSISVYYPNKFQENSNTVFIDFETIKDKREIAAWIFNIFVPKLGLYCKSDSEFCQLSRQRNKVWFQEWLYKNGTTEQRSFMNDHIQIYGKIRVTQFMVDDNQCQIWDKFEEQKKKFDEENNIIYQESKCYGNYVDVQTLSSDWGPLAGSFKDICKYDGDQVSINKVYGNLTEAETLWKCQAYDAFRYKVDSNNRYIYGSNHNYLGNAFWTDLDQDEETMYQTLQEIALQGYMTQQTRMLTFQFLLSDHQSEFHSQIDIGFEINASGLITPCWNMNHFLNVDFHKDLDGVINILKFIFIYSYCVFGIYRLVKKSTDNQNDVEFTNIFWSSQQTYTTFITYIITILSLVFKILLTFVFETVSSYIDKQDPNHFIQIPNSQVIIKKSYTYFNCLVLLMSAITIQYQFKSKKVKILIQIIVNARIQLVGFFIYCSIIQLSLTFICYMIFGQTYSNFNTPFRSFTSVIQFQLGYKELYDMLYLRYPVITSVFFAIFSIVFIIINQLLVSITADSYTTITTIYDYLNKLSPEVGATQHVKDIFTGFKIYLQRYIKLLKIQCRKAIKNLK